MTVIDEVMARLDQEPRGPLSSGKRAALWRAQHRAARRGASLDDLRNYCLEALEHPRMLDPEDENDYLRGYRLGFQLVLREVRRIELARRR